MKAVNAGKIFLKSTFMVTEFSTTTSSTSSLSRGRVKWPKQFSRR